MDGCATLRVLGALAALACFFLVTEVGAEEADPCAGVTCSGHGICTPFEGAPACNCDPGFAPDSTATQCVAEGEPPSSGDPEVEPTPPEGEPDPAAVPEGGEPGGVDTGQPEPPEWGAPPPEGETQPEVEVEPPPPPEPPGVPTVPVTFDFRRGSRRITITAGGEQLRCQTPCTVELPPGQVQIGPPEGSWSPNTTLMVPEVASVATLIRDQGRRLYVAGLIVTAVGGVGTVAGLTIGAFAGFRPAGYIVTIPMSLAFVAGLVVMAIAPESYRVELQAGEAPQEPSAPTARRLRLRSLGFALSPDGGGSAGALFTF